MRIKEFLISGLAVSVAVGVGRLFGFLRELLLAIVFGQTYEADIATLSLVIPDMIANIVLGGAFSAAFMSTFVKGSDQENFNFLIYLHYTIGGFFLFITILFFIYASNIAQAFAPNIPYETQQEFIVLLKITCWCIPFIVFSLIVTTALNAKGIFFLPALGTAVINIIICLSFIMSLFLNKKLLILTAIAIVVGSILRWLFQIIPIFLNARKFNLYYFKPQINKTSIFFRYGQVFLTTSFMLVMPLLARFFMIRTGAGQLANLNYTQKIMDLLIAFIIGSVVTVLLPKLSKSQNSVKIIFFVGIVLFFCFIFASIILYYSAAFIATVFFGHGAFDKSAITNLVVHIKASAFVLPFYSTVLFSTGSLAVTDLASKSAVACFIGVFSALILILLQTDILTYKSIYQSIAYGYGITLLIQGVSIYFHERKVYAKAYVYHQ